MDHPNAPKSVLIIGGSLAGLMHALVLLSLPNPPKVTILERSPTALLHNQGAGIVAGPEVQQFFNEYVRAGREIAITSKQRHYLTKNGEIMDGSVDERQQRMTSWDLLYHLLRWRVEGLESVYVTGLKGDERGSARYENGCTVTGVEEVKDGGMNVTWQQKDAVGKSEVVDLVIAADGASSTVRRLLRPEVERKYCGYVAWRGTVPERELSEKARGVFVEKFTFYHSTGTQALGYLIPGKDGTIKPGERLFNWVWYVNYRDGSAELEELMTDTNGKRHAITLPVGLMQQQVWEKQKKHAADVLPSQYAEAVAKTEQPFIQAITDVISPENSFFHGKLLLVGDALAGFRPHTAASTGQAAFDALLLGKLYGRESGKREYDSSVLEFAARVQKSGVVMGERSQFGHHPLSD
ncbi:hypothetical protein DOTSEDRAFT_69911 [Dothistroma septosporum NZE10]|uniref:2,6-dihydroxypyridine 3-monooxygenase substrate binding domain-containing protein n=1 Tax=Dothistroma septosporum (strain NZE10 / CBS 128990) TaxID=675120 RepID=N1Q0I1_DOTSN|nr:hypothetical protein DOTSEDRAFT_69911 [Dothistroma septosporum NZE10]